MTKIITRRYRLLSIEVMGENADIFLKIHVHERNEHHDNSGTKGQRTLVLGSFERGMLAKQNCETSSIHDGPVTELS